MHLVQLGRQPPDWRSMPTIGAGVTEIRVHGTSEYRVIYVATFPEGVYVLHAFAKRSRQTRRADIEQARVRLRDVAQSRQRR